MASDVGHGHDANEVPLAVDFGNGERVTLNVPVVADDTGYWEGMDAS